MLLGLDRAAADLKMIAAATGYTERAIRTATEEMTLAGFIEEIEGRPPSYCADPAAWARVLQANRLDSTRPVPALPRWRFWAAGFSFLAGVIDWAEKVEKSAWSAYVSSSRARDVYELNSRRLRQAGVDVQPAGVIRGEDYLREFETLVRRVQAWASEGLDPMHRPGDR
jgi:hypothetical protein